MLQQTLWMCAGGVGVKKGWRREAKIPISFATDGASLEAHTKQANSSTDDRIKDEHFSSSYYGDGESFAMRVWKRKSLFIMLPLFCPIVVTVGDRPSESNFCFPK